jgi:hypothetical protein
MNMDDTIATAATVALLATTLLITHPELLILVPT